MSERPYVCSRMRARIAQEEREAREADMPAPPRVGWLRRACRFVSIRWRGFWNRRRLRKQGWVVKPMTRPKFGVIFWKWDHGVQSDE